MATETGRWARVVAGAGAAIVVLAAVIVAAMAWGRRTAAVPPGPTSGLTATLAVEPFHTGDPAPRYWTSAAFAESLVTRLARMPGLTVHRSGGTFDPHTGFVVRGDVTAGNGRLVIAARMYRTSERAVGHLPAATLVLEHLDRHPALESEVAAEVDHGHAAAAELVFDLVAAGEGGAEAVDEDWHGSSYCKPNGAWGTERRGTGAPGHRGTGAPKKGDGDVLVIHATSVDP